mgnify:CR=1 FL=1
MKAAARSAELTRQLLAYSRKQALRPQRTDVNALVDSLASLATDRNRLVQLIQRAAKDGEPFNDVAVFKHRSEVIHAHL